jgi:hypothetical protein
LVKATFIESRTRASADAASCLEPLSRAWIAASTSASWLVSISRRPDQLVALAELRVELEMPLAHPLQQLLHLEDGAGHLVGEVNAQKTDRHHHQREPAHERLEHHLLLLKEHRLPIDEGLVVREDLVVELRHQLGAVRRELPDIHPADLGDLSALLHRRGALVDDGPGRLVEHDPHHGADGDRHDDEHRGVLELKTRIEKVVSHATPVGCGVLRRRRHCRGHLGGPSVSSSPSSSGRAHIT